ncbi:MAG: hypothetical protein WCV58_03195 [Patescibacteria group bacterium]
MDQPTINNPSLQEGQPPLEMPPNITPPEPMGQKPGEQTGNVAPSPVQSIPSSTPPPNLKPLPGPKKPILPFVIIIFLVVVLITGALFFAAWKGWITLGGLFKGSTPEVTVSPKVSPAISSILPSTSPEESSSPTTTTNVNDETRKADLLKIKNALKEYYDSQNSYPVSATATKTSDSSSVLAEALVPAYLTNLPDDPAAPQFYYGYKSDGKTFELTASLENMADTSGVGMGGYNIYKVTDSSTE